MGGLRVAIWGPGVTLPVGQVVGEGAIHSFPPHAPIVSQRYVGENRVLLDGGHGVRVGLVFGAWGDSKVAGLWIDRPEAAVGSNVDPGDVLTDRIDLPAFRFERRL